MVLEKWPNVEILGCWYARELAPWRAGKLRTCGGRQGHGVTQTNLACLAKSDPMMINEPATARARPIQNEEGAAPENQPC